MPRRLLLDGSSLEAVMERVRAEMGPEATVVKAERVRTGGIAGFFAREHYELTVEVPDSPADRRRQWAASVSAARLGADEHPGGVLTAETGPSGVDALLMAADLADLAEAPPARPASAASAGSAASAVRSSADLAPGSAGGPPPAGTPGEPPVGPGPGVVIERSAVPIAALERPAPTAAAPSAAPAFQPAQPPRATVPVEDLLGVIGAVSAGAGAVPASTAPVAAPVYPPKATFPRVSRASLGGDAPSPEVVEEPAETDIPSFAQAASSSSAAATPLWAVEEPAAPTVSTDTPTFESVLDSVRQLAAGPGMPTTEEASAARPWPEPAAEAVPAPEVIPAAPVKEGVTRQDLLSLGLPGRLLAGIAHDAERVTLSDVLSQVPRAPRLLRTPGAVVAIVGLRDDPLAVARSMAARMGLDQHRIALSGELRAVPGFGQWLLTPSAVRRFRDEARQDSSVAMVTVSVGRDHDSWSSARELLEALDADQVWAAVDADRKTADTRRWMKAVGGERSFDGVAVDHLAETTAPGTVLDLGVPVGWFDGHPASPAAWGAVFDERLDERLEWD